MPDDQIRVSRFDLKIPFTFHGAEERALEHLHVSFFYGNLAGYSVPCGISTVDEFPQVLIL